MRRWPLGWQNRHLVFFEYCFPKGAAGRGGELQLISTRKQSFLLKRPKAVLPVSWQGLPSRPSTSSQQAGNPNLRRGLQSQSQRGLIVLFLPLKPVTSPPPPPSSKAPKFNPYWDWTVGEVQPEGVALPARVPFLLSTGTAGGSLGWGAGQGQV